MGLHARPVTEFVRKVRSHPESKVTVSAFGRKVSGMSMLSILSLGLKCGTEVELTVEGGQEALLADSLAEFIASASE